MRLALLSSASAVGLLALVGPAAADSDFTGVGQLFLGAGSSEQAGFFSGKQLGDPFLYGGKGKGYWPLSPDVHLQVDLFAQQTDDIMANDGSEGWTALATDTTEFGAAIHLLHPFEKRARFGLAGSIWSNEVFDFTSSGTVDVTYALAALEGQFFGTDWTITGQAGLFGEISCGSECFLALREGEFIRGKARYYLNDNTALTVEALQMWGSFDDVFFGNKSLNSSIWSLEAEHKFQDSPFSAYLGVSHERTESNDIISASADASTFVLGVKFYLDQPTLRSNDQTGAELDTPLFGNAIELAGPLQYFAAD